MVGGGKNFKKWGGGKMIESVYFPKYYGRGGEKMIESDNIYPCLDYLSLPLPFDLTFSQNSKYCSFTCFSVIFDL